MVLMMAACEEPKEENEEWPNTSGYTYFRTSDNEKRSVSPGEKYYSSGIFGSVYGSSIDLTITSEQNCLITIDFSKFKFGSYSVRLNGVSFSSRPIIITAGDTLVFVLNPNGKFSSGSNRDWMIGFSVKDACDLGHDFRWTVTDTTYPATSTEKPCTRCDTPSISGEPPRITQIGDTGPGGGIIVYISSEGFDFYTGTTATNNTKITAYYLEAANKDQDQGKRLRWCSATSGIPVDISSTQTAIGTGKRNTALILFWDSRAPAAKACNDYKGGDKNDWFLPGRDEAIEMFKQSNHLDGIMSDWYWSSSQSDRSYAWGVYSSSGNSTAGFKTGTDSVRAIRIF